MKKQLGLILIIILMNVSVTQAQSCRSIFAPKVDFSSLKHPQVEKALNKIVNNGKFPLLFKRVITKILKRDDIDFVFIGREEATLAGFPLDGQAYFFAKRSKNRFRPFVELFKGEYIPPEGLSPETLRVLNRDYEKHFIVVVEPKGSQVKYAAMANSIIHELSHLVFSEILSGHSSIIKKHFSNIKHVFRFGGWTFYGYKIDYLDEVFANYIEYLSAHAISEEFNVNWHKKAFALELPHKDPQGFISEWVRQQYEISYDTAQSFNFENLDQFIREALNVFLEQ